VQHRRYQLPPEQQILAQAVVAPELTEDSVTRLQRVRPAIHRSPDRAQVAAARSVVGIQDIEKLRVRRIGPEYFPNSHISLHSDSMLSLRDAHVLSGKVNVAIRVK